MDRKVSVFICGVQKAGTTSLHAHCMEHPALSAPDVKELHFFDDMETDWAAPDYDRLHRFFPQNDAGRLRLDNTPIYSFWPGCINRIQAYNPDAKVILLFRDPYDRAWSQWRMEYARGNEILAFSEAIRQGRARLENLALDAPPRRLYSFIERGMYGAQTRRVLAAFPRNQVLFLRTEDFWADHRATLAKLAAFLGIPPFRDTGPKHKLRGGNANIAATRTEADRAYVAGLLQDDVREFASLTGLDISDWPVMR
jgi:hypothetical protein